MSLPGAGLYRDPRNTGPQTRARYEYQDSCVALRCIDNLAPTSPIVAVAVEWATDYVLIGADGTNEMVSVKHRDSGQDDWSYADLKNEHVLRDLHAVWKAMGEAGEYVFESNRGFSRTAAQFVIDAIHPQATQQDVAKLARDLQIDVAEAGRFLEHLRLRRDPLPDRRYIDAVAIRDLQRLMPDLGLDPARAPEVYTAIVARIAAASIQRPPSPADRVERLVGLMRDVASRGGPDLADRLVLMADLRLLVAEASAQARRPRELLVADPLFVGREPQMAQLDDHLDLGGEAPVAPVVLSGMPGIGKSALARQYAAERGSIMAVHILPADTRAALAEALFALTADAPRDTSPDNTRRPASPRTSELDVPDDPRLLLIVDGVTDPDTVEGLIPRRSATRFIVTTTATHLDDAFVHIAIHPLGRDESVAYLRSVLADEDSAALGEVADVFAGHPLGLVQAASYCRSQRITIAGYLTRIRNAPIAMLDLGRAPGHPTPTAAAIRDAFGTAVETESAAMPLAFVMACAAPEPLPERIFEDQVIVTFEPGEPSETQTALVALSEILTRDRAIGALHQFSLVIRENATLKVHPLVQSIIRERIPLDQRQLWARSVLVLLLYAAEYQNDGPSKAREATALGAHIAAAVEYAVETKSEPEVIFAAFGWLGMWQLRYGDLGIATAYLSRGVEIAKTMEQPSARVVAALAQLASAQRMGGNITEALSSIEEWLEVALVADDGKQVRAATLARAQTLAYAARYPDARAAFDAMAAAEAGTAVGVRERIFRQSLLADIETGLGRLDAALDAIDAAFALVPGVHDEQQRTDHTAALHKQAGITLRDSGRLEEAIPHLRAAWDITEDLPSIYRTEITLALLNALVDLHQLDEARSLVEKGLAAAAVRGETSPVRGSLLQVRGRIALESGDPQQARSDLEAAVQMLRHGGDPYRPNLASAYFNLAVVHGAQQRHDEAVQYARMARNLTANVFGPHHGELIHDELMLATVCCNAGNYGEAHEAIRRCLVLVQAGHWHGRKLRNQILEIAITIDVNSGELLLSSPQTPPSNDDGERNPAPASEI
ncbi:tetratricopeptide repeat protein [Dactylosporangium sp. NPDC048998]|uniref:tetratricopeptide repeat protein n=1 Tax=Dactylosporangium sp. NPDC048998 TaxID=3363976 RepID=UPI00371B1C2A